jgi:hypothetical protein
MLTSTNAQAYGVLAAIYFQLGDRVNEIRVESYHNCREEGFAISGLLSNSEYDWQRRAVFSENRNSDSIVLYTGKTIDFDISSGIPSEETYRRARYFPPLDFEGVAEAALQSLKK